MRSVARANSATVRDGRRQSCGEDETMRLERVARDFSTDHGFNARLVDFRFEVIAPWVRGAERCLELGCADGRMTERLRRVVKRLTAVDGSLEQVRRTRRRCPDVEVVHALFEQYQADATYDVVVLAHVLEHVADPVALLARAAACARPGGRLVVTVPNADSLHRQAGVELGLIEDVTALDEQDLRIGHRRVYTRTTLLRDLQTAGLVVDHLDGVFLKPLPNDQIERQWGEALIRAYFELGRRYPQIAAEIVAIAQVPASGVQSPLGGS
ncbi:class I SAM-dependent methyltransferase [Thermoleophilum album]|nr:class I SAM-dependent methyltransferase [Thermoleophilum album]